MTQHVRRGREAVAKRRKIAMHNLKLQICNYIANDEADKLAKANICLSNLQNKGV